MKIATDIAASCTLLLLSRQRSPNFPSTAPNTPLSGSWLATHGVYRLTAQQLIERMSGFGSSTAKFIILNTQFLVFNTQFLVLMQNSSFLLQNSSFLLTARHQEGHDSPEVGLQSIILNTKSIILNTLNTKFLIFDTEFTPLPAVRSRLPPHLLVKIDPNRSQNSRKSVGNQSKTSRKSVENQSKTS